MAIMKCKECGADVSTKARTCPSCGSPIETGGRIILNGVKGILTMAFVVWFVRACSSDTNNALNIDHKSDSAHVQSYSVEFLVRANQLNS